MSNKPVSKRLSIIAWLFFWVSCRSWAVDLQADNPYPKVELETSLGQIVLELDRTRAPITVDNFLTYVVQGEYDDTVFHRVISNFVVQGGGLNSQLEELPARQTIINEAGNGLTNRMGTIAMARTTDPHSATRQFYFNMADNTNLDPSARGWGYAVFGEVIAGKAVLEAIAAVETTTHAKLRWPNVPVTPVILKKARLVAQK